MDGPFESCFCGKRIFADRRLDQRLENTFNRMARRPEGTLPKKMVKRTDLVGAYRMFNNRKVTHEGTLQAHRAKCMERLKDYKGKVLVLQDTTVLDYSGLDVDGLGQVGDGHGQGLYAHNSLVVIPSTRDVVGLVHQILHQRRRVPPGETKKQRAERAGRESRLWKRTAEGLPAMPAGVQATDVSDRGSDISEYLAYEVAAGRQFIVRSQHNRHLTDEQGDESIGKLHDVLRELPAMARYTVRVPAEEGGWREASMTLAWQRVHVRLPRQPRGEHGAEPLELWGVIAREEGAPAGQAPLEWILVTNRRVESAEAAREVVEDYACRWMIEDYHKAIKTGCGIEQMQMTTLHGLSNAIAVLSVLGVHLLRLRCKARDEQISQQPARLHEDAVKVQLAAQDSKHADWRAMTVWEFYIAVARMGGYVLNPRKRPPGWLVLWRGYIRLEDMCEGIRLMKGARSVQT